MLTIKQFQFYRVYTLIHLKHIDEKKWDAQPDGFSNTIRWNAGHLYVTAEGLLHRADTGYEMKKPEWAAFFAPGTRPAEWKEEPPASTDIIASLEEQSGRIASFFEGKLNNPASEPLVIQGHSMDSGEAILQFVSWHEGIHTGMIKSLDKIIR